MFKKKMASYVYVTSHHTAGCGIHSFGHEDLDTLPQSCFFMGLQDIRSNHVTISPRRCIVWEIASITSDTYPMCAHCMDIGRVIKAIRTPCEQSTYNGEEARDIIISCVQTIRSMYARIIIKSLAWCHTCWTCGQRHDSSHAHH